MEYQFGDWFIAFFFGASFWALEFYGRKLLANLSRKTALCYARSVERFDLPGPFK